jgi:aspartate/methionine/tyrosine aminotransferase
MPVSRRQGMPGTGVDRMGSEADAAGDPSVLRLENLDTDLRPPPAALEATRRAVDDDHANSYLPFLGADALRQAVAAHVGRLSGQTYDWRASCVITAGGLNGILTSLLALLEPGNRVALAEPISKEYRMIGWSPSRALPTSGPASAGLWSTRAASVLLARDRPPAAPETR